MTDALSDVAAALSSSLMLAKELQVSNLELLQIFTAAELQADQAKTLDVEEQKVLQWKSEMLVVKDSAMSLKHFCSEFLKQKKKLGKKLEEMARKRKSEVSEMDLQAVIDSLKELMERAADFGEEFQQFCTGLDKAKAAASELISELEKMEKEQRSAANWNRIKGGAGFIAMTAFAGGMIYVSSGAAAFLAVKLVAGAAAAGGLLGASIAAKTSWKAADLSSIADRLRRQAASLQPHVDILLGLLSRTDGQLELNQQQRDAMDQVIAKVQDEIQQQQLLVEKDEEIAALRAQLAAMKQQQQGSDNEALSDGD